MSSEVLREGRASMGYAMVAATVAFAIFGGLSIALLVVPKETGPFHWILGAPCVFFALLVYPWQFLDIRARRHVLKAGGLRYESGVLGKVEVEIPYRSIQAVTVSRGVLQRLFGCGDVRLSAPGVAGSVLVSSRDLNSLVLRAIPDYAEVAAIVRERMEAEDGV